MCESGRRVPDLSVAVSGIRPGSRDTLRHIVARCSHYHVSRSDEKPKHVEKTKSDLIKGSENTPESVSTFFARH